MRGNVDGYQNFNIDAKGAAESQRVEHVQQEHVQQGRVAPHKQIERCAQLFKSAV